MAKPSAKSATKDDGPPQPKVKIPPVRIDTSDCEVFVGRVIEDGEIVPGKEGTGYMVHKGESVWAIPLSSLGAWLGLSGVTPDGDSEEDAVTQLAGIEVGFTSLCVALSKRIVSWDWTDLGGDPLSQPWKRPEVFRELSVDELIFLAGAINREGTDEAKNGGGG